MMTSKLQRMAEELAEKGLFVGGPVEHFDAVGRHQLVTLLEHGLMPYHTVLDLGCGCLRAGYWLIHFLEPGRYLGIEPNKVMLQAGLDTFIDEALVELKQPRFDNNDQFDFAVFRERIDFVLARSIWTHAAPRQIETMLDQFVEHTTPDAVFLTSYLPAKRFRHQYDGLEWVGRSDKSSTPGMVRYRLRWIRECCERRGLTVEELDNNILSQIWLKIVKTDR